MYSILWSTQVGQHSVCGLQCGLCLHTPLRIVSYITTCSERYISYIFAWKMLKINGKKECAMWLQIYTLSLTIILVCGSYSRLSIFCRVVGLIPSSSCSCQSAFERDTEPKVASVGEASACVNEKQIVMRFIHQGRKALYQSFYHMSLKQITIFYIFVYYNFLVIHISV